MKAANQATQAAFQAFKLTISNAAQTSVSTGTAPDSKAVTAAVATLQTAVTSAIGSLGTSLTSSAFDPWAAITADLTALTTQLTSITAPSVSNPASARVFLRAVNSAVSQSQGTIGRTIATPIGNDNNGLL